MDMWDDKPCGTLSAWFWDISYYVLEAIVGNECADRGWSYVRNPNECKGLLTHREGSLERRAGAVHWLIETQIRSVMMRPVEERNSRQQAPVNINMMTPIISKRGCKLRASASHPRPLNTTGDDVFFACLCLVCLGHVFICARVILYEYVCTHLLVCDMYAFYSVSLCVLK